VFGGQVISQAIVSATNCVDKAYGLHSLHVCLFSILLRNVNQPFQQCYFLLSGSPAVPITYYVERLREGRSYTTRLIKAVQNGKLIFVLMCSFQKPEPYQPSHAWPLPSNVPNPEDCELQETIYTREAMKEGVDERLKNIYMTIINERVKSPIAWKPAKLHDVGPDGTITYMYWMSARNLGTEYGVPFQKCVVAYLSDLNFIGVGVRTLGLKRNGRGPGSVGMTSSLDHSIYFYDDNFDCGDWLLYVV